MYWDIRSNLCRFISPFQPFNLCSCDLPKIQFSKQTWIKIHHINASDNQIAISPVDVLMRFNFLCWLITCAQHVCHYWIMIVVHLKKRKSLKLNFLLKPIWKMNYFLSSITDSFLPQTVILFCRFVRLVDLLD